MTDTNRAEPMKPCPFCGGAAELDTRQGYTYAKYGQPRHGTAVAVYCTECTVQISVCREDVPDIAPEAVIEMWNRRVEVEASRLPLAGAATSDWVGEFCAKWSGVDKVEAGEMLEWLLRNVPASPAPSDAAVQPVAQVNIGGASSIVAEYAAFQLLPAGAKLSQGRHDLYTFPLPTAPAGAREAMEKAIHELSHQSTSGYVSRAIEVLRAALAAAPLERIAPWMSIETAPQDGSHILAFHPELGQRETYWHFYGAGSIAKADWIARKPGAQSGYWDWSEPQNHWGSSWKPTRWMPLPAAPAIEAEHGITLAPIAGKGDGNG